MVKNILYLLVIIMVVSACKTPQRDCNSFKTGEFSYEELIDGELVTTRFTRNDTLEVAYFNDKVDSSSVRWINDCEWIVKKINPKSMSEQKAVHMKILFTEGDLYTFEYSLVGKNIKQRGTAKKLN
ncbi:DNA topoisomerase IV [Dokdonia ponticola]|uniref:DNA topoisomerase IV n=1 Tax=Dokdonia ponticola TaxID=2041041 RepID=A0ABV9HTB7_9FLAO